MPWVAGNAGLTFQSGSAEQLARCLDQLFSNPEQLKQLRENAILRARLFDPRAVAEQYVRNFNNAHDAVVSKAARHTGVRTLRILVVSPFYPNVGGIETVFAILVREWEKRGHEVRIIHPGPVKHGEWTMDAPDHRIYYVPPSRVSLRLHQWCDICIHGSLNTRHLGVLLVSRRPCIITQHGSVTTTGLKPLTWLQRVKRWLSRRFPNITCSEYVARDLGVCPLGTGNPYRDDIFKPDSRVVRDRDFIFVGRLVSDKGLPLLLRALAELHESGRRKSLTVIGNGPQLEWCRTLVGELGLEKWVQFLGILPPVEVAAELRRHQIQVIPSSFHEPFGIVALEGAACGCFIVASKGGGMPESVGPCGILFENNSQEALTRALREALAAPTVPSLIRERHLSQFRAPVIAEMFLSAIRQVLNQS